MTEYRPLADDEMDDFRAYVKYAFSSEEGPYTPDEADDDEDDDEEEVELGDEYGLFDDELVSVCRHYWFRTWVRGSLHDMAGLSAVATPPEYRRRGYVRDMLSEALAEYRADDVYLSALWPFKTSFYRRLGWGTAFVGYKHECEPSALASFRASRDGEWTRLSEDDWERMAPVHDAHGAGFELTVERDEDWWRERVFSSWKQTPYVYGYERDGELAAYATYVVRESGGDRTMAMQDVAWVDHDAREALYGFLARHESQMDRVRLWGPDDDVLWFADLPGEMDVEVNAGAMFRLVDVPAALEALTYPADVDAEFVLGVDDPLADWNDGAFRVAIADGEAAVTATDDDPDASLRVDALSQLYVGARGVSFLTRTDALEADADAAAVLASAFPESDVLLREGF